MKGEKIYVNKEFITKDFKSTAADAIKDVQEEIAFIKEGVTKEVKQKSAARKKWWFQKAVQLFFLSVVVREASKKLPMEKVPYYNEF